VRGFVPTRCLRRKDLKAGEASVHPRGKQPQDLKGSAFRGKWGELWEKNGGCLFSRKVNF